MDGPWMDVAPSSYTWVDWDWMGLDILYWVKKGEYFQISPQDKLHWP